MRLVRTICLTVAATVLGHIGPSAAGPRVDVPITQSVLPDGDTRYSVPITVGGGAPMEAELDTGSFGLRVLKAAMTPDQFAPTDMRRVYGFGGGARFDGVLARATVGVGPSQTERPILFQVIDKVGCVKRQPRCAASKVKPQDYRIAGDGYARQGFDAILGISMRRAPIEDSAVNPLTAMGSASWIVILPQPGSAEPGHLILDPTDDDRAGFDMLQLEPQGGGSGALQGWADGALPGCLVDEDAQRRYCGRTLLDTGAPGFVLASPDVTRPSAWNPGTRARLEIAGASSPIAVSFTSGGDWSTRVFVHPPRGMEAGRLSAGTLPFFSYAILYDAVAGRVGFKRRD